MDLTSNCKDKMAYFRIKELKEILSKLGLAKQGKKQDLVNRILDLLSDERDSKSHGWGKKFLIGKAAVAKLIDDTYRKMQVPGAVDLASTSNSGSDLDQVKPKGDVKDSYQLNMKVRCLCGSSLFTESMIRCEDPRCQVWQHIGCIIIPEKQMEGVQPNLPSQFYCDMCRLNRADPFWVTTGHPLLPLKLTSSGTTANGTTVQTIERTFQLSKADRELLQRTEYDLQVWCILLNDKVPFRMQWPLHVGLQVNGVPVRTTNRSGAQLLGINGRDDGPVITTCSREGSNTMCLSRDDARIFCFGIRIGRRRTPQQVLSLVPKVAEGELFEEAVSRVCRCVGGGTTTENADSDSDLEVVADSVTVNLRCPMSGSRIRTAGRFKPCAHMACFDLEAFVELNQRSRKWQCPICLKNYSLEDIIIDPYFNRITSLMRHCGEDVTEIEVKPDGSWRAKNESELRDLGKWHLSDSSICTAANAAVKADLEMLEHIKEEGASEGWTRLKLGTKRNNNGICVFNINKPEDLQPPENVLERYEDQCHNIIPMSSSATGSYRDGEDPSVNQEVHFDLAMNNGHELDSLSLNFDSKYNFEDRIPPAQLKDADVIVLSDSEDDNVTIVSPETLYETGPAAGTEFLFSSHPGVSETFLEATGTTGCLDLLNSNVDEFQMPMWPTCPPTDSGFQLFETNTYNPDGLVDPRISLSDTLIADYNLAPDGGLVDSAQIQDPYACGSNVGADGSMEDDHLAFSRDPSFKIFLPSQPTSAPVDANQHSAIPDGDYSDDWTSLTLAAGGRGDTARTGELSSRQTFTSKESMKESLADTASLFLSMNDDRHKKGTSNSERSDSPFFHPHQPRSVRPRLYLSIDTDSE